MALASSSLPKRNVLTPSKCTAYISNLPFSFTNSDIFKIFEKYGKIVKVTIMRDKITRQSKGVAFILFSEVESTESCVKSVNGAEMFGRTLQANIAKDNGRAPEFIKRKEYPDKSKCFECREIGHLSYSCPQNILGVRQPPPKKKRKRKSKETSLTEGKTDDFQTDEDEISDDESLSAAIRYQQELREGENFLSNQSKSQGSADVHDELQKARKIKQSSYFSDEENDEFD